MTVKTDAVVLALFASTGAYVKLRRSGNHYILIQDIGGGREWRVTLEQKTVGAATLHVLAKSEITQADGANLFTFLLGDTSAYEYAVQAIPAGATAVVQFVGNLHGYDNQTVFTLAVDGAPVTPDDGQTLTGNASIVVTRTTELTHPQTGTTVWAAVTVTYTLTPADGLRVQSSWDFAVAGSMVGGYMAMLPTTDDTTRGSILGVEQDYNLEFDDDRTRGYFRNSLAWLFESAGHYAALLYVTDHASTDHFFFQDRAGGTINKLYANQFAAATPFIATDIWAYDRYFKVGYFADMSTLANDSATWHGYIGAERSGLTVPQFAELTGWLTQFAPETDALPANRNHGVVEGITTVREGLFNVDQLTTATLILKSATILNVATGDLSVAATEGNYSAGNVTTIWTFSQGETGLCNVKVFGTLASIWAQSGAECRAYLRVN